MMQSMAATYSAGSPSRAALGAAAKPAAVLVWLTVGAIGTAAAAENGRLTGTIDKPKLVKAVFAKDRMSEEKDRIYQGRIDGKTGQFVVEGLPVDAVYDLIIDYDGGRLEGVNLKVPPSDYEEEQPLTKEDMAALKKTCINQSPFEDKIEVLAIEGNCQHAAILLNKLRTRPFYESKPGEVIWRLELWHFEKPEETWVKDQDELFIVFYRERLQKRVFDKKALTLDPRLGGHKPTAKKPALSLGKIELPGQDPGIRLRRN
jgi:hypothetical protein